MGTETYQPLYSSNIASATYDTDTSQLTMIFKSGDEYQYSSVPHSVFLGLQNALSAGEYFARQIKNNYNYEQV